MLNAILFCKKHLEPRYEIYPGLKHLSPSINTITKIVQNFSEKGKLILVKLTQI